MKIIEEVPNPCMCATRRKEFLASRQQSGFEDLGVGSVIECDCGVNYILVDGEGGQAWVAR